MMNDVVKERDELLEATKADYEILKSKLFAKLYEAIEDKYSVGFGRDYTKNMVAMAKWTVLKEVVDAAGLSAEFEDYYRETKEGKK
jgi:hypothetical protein